MQKKILLTVALAVLLAVPLGSAFAYEAFVGPTGVIQYNQDKAYPGYVVFAMTGAGNTKSYLIDLEGYVVHEWKTDYVAALHEQILSNGNLIRQQKPWQGQTAADAVVPVPKYGQVKLQQQKYPFTTGAYISVGGGHAGLLQEFDWDGNLVWEYERNTSTSVSHHTFTRHPTAGTTLILGWEYKSQAECIAQGRNPATVGPRGLWPDYITEINNATKAVIWEYHVWDNLVQNFDSTKPNYGDPKTNQDKFDLNWICDGAATETGIPDWTHWNTANYDMTAGSTRIIANSRHWGESYIIDRGTGGKGKLIWRFGNPSAYGMGVAPSYQNDGTQLDWGPHHAHIIDPGLPGAGNMLILDNGWNRPAGNRTRTIEVDITKSSSTSARVGFSATGTLTPFANINPGSIVWQFFSNTPNSYYSASQCANQRLPNANTFLTSTQSGHLFQVTKGERNSAGNWVNKQIVWEFISPVFTDSSTSNGVFQTDTVGSIHRATHYGVDYAGLQGRDLSRQYHISGQPEFWKMMSGKVAIPASLDPNNPVIQATQWQALSSAVPSLPTGWGWPPTGTGFGGGGGGAGGGGGGGGY